MMRRILTLLVLSFCVKFLFAQVYTGKSFELRDPQQIITNQITYNARDKIRLLPGFKAKGGNSYNNGFRALISPDLPLQTNPIPPYLDVLNTSLNKDLAIGAISGEAKVLLDGSANYNIPISVPPGTGGMVPNLILNYNSNLKDELLGYGWGLSGLSGISAVGKSLSLYDEPEAIFASAQFSLDGNRLLKVNGELKTESEIYSKIEYFGPESDPVWFRVENKSGLVYEYGLANNSKVKCTSSQRGILWRVSKIYDKNGNYMSFYYDNNINESRIIKITYTGNSVTGLPAYNEIIFNYSLRKENYKYVDDCQIRTRSLLDNITVLAQGKKLRFYDFTYSYESKIYQLASVKYSNGVNDAVNSTYFEYFKEDGTPTEFTTTGVGLDNVDLGNADFNADGVDDILAAEYYYVNSSKYHRGYKIYINDGSGHFTLKYQKTFTSGSYYYVPDIKKRSSSNSLGLADFNGDGTSDILVINIVPYQEGGYTGTKVGQVAISYVDPKIDDFRTSDKVVLINNPYILGEQSRVFQFGDYNGDKYMDILVLGTTNPSIDPLSLKVVWHCPFTDEVKPTDLPLAFYGSAKKIVSQDFNGDGRSELLIMNEGFARNNAIFSFSKGLNQLEAFELDTTYFATHEQPVFSGDFNGDGQVDFLVGDKYAQSWQTVYFKGTKYERYELPGFGNVSSSTQILISDINKDGYSDIIKVYDLLNGGTKVEMYLFKGMNNYELVQYSQSWHLGSFSSLGDFNGDGNPDLLNREGPVSLSFVSFGRHPYAHLLKGVVNGNGVYSGFEYATLGDKTHYSKKVLSPDLTVGFHPPMVGRMTFTDGIGGYNFHEYTYENNLYDRKQGVLGFRSVSCLASYSNPTIAKRTTVIEQAYDGFGNLYPAKTEVFVGDDAQLASVQQVVKFTRDLGNKQHSDGNLIVISIDHLKKIQVKKEKKFDDSMNLISDQNDVFDLSNLSIGPVESELTEYFDYISAGSWRINVPSRIKTTLKRYGNPDDFSVENEMTYYPLNGQLKTQEQFSNKELPITTAFEYDQFGNKNKITISASGMDDRISTFRYDVTGRFMLEEVNALGYSNQFTYDPATGYVISKKDHNGLVSTRDYDAWGRLVCTTGPTGVKAFTEYSWTSANEVSINTLTKERSYADGQPEVIQYFDLFKRVVCTKTQAFDGTNVFSYTKYSSLSEIEEEIGPHSTEDQVVSTKHQYDAFRRKTSMQVNDLRSNQWSYDLKKASFTNAITSGYEIIDATGKVAESNDGLGSVLNYYHSTGGLQSTTVGQKNINVEYDEYGRRKRLYDSDAGHISYEYNAFGELKLTKNFNNNLEYDILYDKLGRVITKKRKHGVTGQVTSYSYEYNNVIGSNGLGELKVARTAGSEVSYEYDSFARCILERTLINGVAYEHRFEYDKFGRVTRHFYPSGYGVENTYNSKGFHTKIAQLSDGKVLWELLAMDAKGKITKSKQGTQITSTNVYDKYGYLLNTDSKVNGQAITNWAFTWDPSKGHLQSRENLKYGLKESFTYDHDRLATVLNATGQTTLSTSYAADGSSQITSKSDAGNFKYDDQIPVNGVKALENLVTGFPTTNQDIDYNSFNKAELIKENGYELAIQYGVQDQRMSSQLKLNGSIRYSKVFVGDYEVKTANGVKSEFHYVSSPEGLIAVAITEQGNNKLYYTRTDYLGSVQEVYNENGTLKEEYSFNAWGSRRDATTWNTLASAQEWSGLLDRGYTGHEHLDVFGIINMNGRLYDPLMGMMLSPDKFISDNTSTIAYNRFLYANGNPMKYADPSGDLVGVIIFGVIGAYAGGVIANDGELNPVKWNWRSFKTYAGIIVGGAVGATGGYAIEGLFTNTIGYQVGLSTPLGGIGIAGGAGSGIDEFNWTTNAGGSGSTSFNTDPNLNASLNSNYSYSDPLPTKEVGGIFTDRKVFVNFLYNTTQHDRVELSGVEFTFKNAKGEEKTLFWVDPWINNKFDSNYPLPEGYYNIPEYKGGTNKHFIAFYHTHVTSNVPSREDYIFTQTWYRKFDGDEVSAAHFLITLNAVYQVSNAQKIRGYAIIHPILTYTDGSARYGKYISNVNDWLNGTWTNWTALPH